LELFSKILIANRGEIAVRIIRTCKEMNIKTVAVYSDVDKNSLHVKMADESICIGPARSSNSYLNINAIITAAEITKAEAVHPGYGFLAENSSFAAACEQNNIVFIGPTITNMQLLGDKIQARKKAITAGVPLFGGSEGSLSDSDEACRIAEGIGYPVMLKASLGGGGRGLKIVENKKELKKYFNLLKTEATSSFGCGDMFLEKYCRNAKHVEIQILADNFGQTVYLGERDCSIQRRHQKIIEESPCNVLDDEVRQKIGEAAVRLAKEVGYINAGTIEFLLDENNNFHFLEMNTRIQVEHPVTEMITGIDIVRTQILVAAGKPLPFKQEDIRFTGHAIECRINAEDTLTFVPSPGKITKYKLPGGFGVRVDTFIQSDYNVEPYYDSLIAKLIVHGEDRDTCIDRMKRALSEFEIEGIKTNVGFHQKILGAPIFKEGTYTTNCLSKLKAAGK